MAKNRKRDRDDDVETSKVPGGGVRISFEITEALHLRLLVAAIRQDTSTVDTVRTALTVGLALLGGGEDVVDALGMQRFLRGEK